jgi:pimeloyl-ACP methyl ester carboxylesterase
MGGMGFEPAEEIKGVRTVEGSPEGGLRYRLRMSPSATAERPDRLIVWLHPAGGSMNQAVEPLSERFAKLGYALLVLTQKDWRFWSGPDVEKLFTKTLPEVAKVPGLRVESPILMGYSAGGQAALMVWQANPGKFGGLVLDAAYPVRQTPKGVEIVQLPDDPAAKQTPMFVLVGDKDGGSQVWRTLEPIWRRAGVPLTIRYIPDKGHAWLFGPKELDDLAKWLEQLGAGKPPAAPEAPKDREETKPK